MIKKYYNIIIAEVRDRALQPHFIRDSAVTLPRSNFASVSLAERGH